MKHVLRIASVCLSLGFLACAPGPRAPTQAQTSAVAAVRSAEAMGASGFPRASYHLALAHEQLQTALGLIEEDEDEDAALYLERAHADAELAIALTREARATADARRAERAETP